VAEIISIDLEHGEPAYVTVKMCAEELAFIAKVMGKMLGNEAEAIMPGGGEQASENLYEAATSDVFNRWYDGGVDEYLRSR
jgi:hypothetical protein